MKSDKILKTLVAKEIKRQNETIDLIPSENVVSNNVLKFLGSPLANKYSEGYPGRRYYAGNNFIDDIELLAQKRARRVFGLGGNWHVNVQPYSGSPANMAVYYALLSPGEKIMGMSLPFGGHLTHGWNVNFSAKFYKSVQYEVGKDGFIDYNDLYKKAKKENPKIIVAGATAYPRILDFSKFGRIAKEVKAYFLADISHIAGLVVAKEHPSPFPYADVVTTTTHKTLRGPRGAIIFANKKSEIARRDKTDISREIDKAVFPGLQGGPHDNQTAAIAAALNEAGTKEFEEYNRQVVKNSKALAEELKKLGFNLVSGGTDNHLALVDLSNFGMSGGEAQSILEKSGIIVNKNTIPYDIRSPFDPSGIRIGTPAVTTRGMMENEMKQIANFIFEALAKGKNVKNKVRRFCLKFPIGY